MSYRLIRKIGDALGFEEEGEEKKGLTPVGRQPFKIAVFAPLEFEDVKKIADALLARSAVLIHLNQAETSLRIRLVDYMNGLSYALDAQAEKISGEVVLYVPTSASVEMEAPRAVKSSRWF
jgi:FtsZ-interacting cell division protein YlmF